MEKILNNTYWENRYAKNETGWDTGEITPPLKGLFDSISNKEQKILVPGCGNGYEVEYLFNRGFKNVYAADVASIPLLNL